MLSKSFKARLANVFLVVAFCATFFRANSMKTALITGSNRGIGLELTKQLAAGGWKVFASCRAPSAALSGINLNGGKLVEGADVGTEEGVNILKAAVGSQCIDVLINNAGVLSVESLDDMNFDRIRQQFEVNAIGPLRVTTALKPNLKRGSKVIIITSRMGSIADNGSGGFYGYRMSKTAVNMAGTSLARDLAPEGICVQIIHPGMVETDMTAQWGGGIPASESAANIITRVQAASMATTGKFFHANGEELPW